jgi:ATP-dependent RNA helicase DDX10/DBP4
LAFLIPVLECLYRNKWTQFDGIGALIITPTRELSYQIFEVLRKVGAYHEFSAALVIGGKDLKFEQKRMDKCNIVICTPGRLLDHMDQNPLFNCDNLKILVLDEADRCLDMGFAKTMNAIIANLPQQRQTFLFSATQTKSVKDLVRLSLSDPKYVSVHELSQYSTPDSLKQSYIVCELNQKLNLLWSFIKAHLRQKILVFMSTCKQVKYVYELFCRMKPGSSLLALYGSLHQLRRMAIYDEFCRKQNVILFATDIASRGLDFPSVNYVIQLDCPEDVNTYIHRVGRTARYEKSGESVLVLLPNEEDSMVKQLNDRKIPLDMISVRETKILYIQRKAEALCARDKNLKDSAQRAFKAYIKNVFLMKDKSVFNVEYLNFDLFAKSLGLAVTPRVRFVEKSMKSRISTSNTSTKHSEESSKSNNIENFNFQMSDSDSENNDDLLSVKKVYRFDLSDEIDSNDDEILNQMPTNKPKKAITKAAMAKKILKRGFKPNTRIVFDDEGVATNGEFPTRQVSDKIKMLDDNNISGIDIEISKQIMKDEDTIDKKLYRNKVKDKHKV